MALNDALMMEATLFGELCETEDIKEGMKAFLKNRILILKENSSEAVPKRAFQN